MTTPTLPPELPPADGGTPRCNCARLPREHDEQELCIVGREGFNAFLGEVQGRLLTMFPNEQVPEWPDTIDGLGDLDSALDSCTQWCADRLRELAAAIRERDDLAQDFRDLSNDQQQCAEKLSEAEVELAAATKIIATWKRHRIERPSGCACELDDAGENVLKWCAAHAALQSALSRRLEECSAALRQACDIALATTGYLHDSGTDPWVMQQESKIRALSEQLTPPDAQSPSPTSASD